MLDAFLDYNRDPEYIRRVLVYRLTIQSLKLMDSHSITKRELARKLHTSPTQLYRLLDATIIQNRRQYGAALGALGIRCRF